MKGFCIVSGKLYAALRRKLIYAFSNTKSIIGIGRLNRTDSQLTRALDKLK